MRKRHCLRHDAPLAAAYPYHRPVPASRQARAYVRALLDRKAGSDDRRFLIFAQGRTGSSLLVDLLNGNPGVRCDGELLARPVVLPTAWLDAHRARHRKYVYGFKVKLYQLTMDQALADPRGWLARMERTGWRVIYLWRRNLLRHVLSNVVAVRTGRYRLHAQAGGAAPPPIQVDVAEILRLMRARERVRQEERAVLAGIPHETVCYEDDLLRSQRHQPTLDRLGRGLRLEPAQARTTLRRINEGPVPSLVSNHGELERALRGTAWEQHLD